MYACSDLSLVNDFHNLKPHISLHAHVTLPCAFAFKIKDNLHYYLVYIHRFLMTEFIISLYLHLRTSYLVRFARRLCINVHSFNGISNQKPFSIKLLFSFLFILVPTIGAKKD